MSTRPYDCGYASIASQKLKNEIMVLYPIKRDNRNRDHFQSPKWLPHDAKTIKAFLLASFSNENVPSYVFKGVRSIKMINTFIHAPLAPDFTTFD